LLLPLVAIEQPAEHLGMTHVTSVGRLPGRRITYHKVGWLVQFDLAEIMELARARSRVPYDEPIVVVRLGVTPGA
jgi:hypothetical protein